jgi:hypothetical protein
MTLPDASPQVTPHASTSNAPVLMRLNLLPKAEDLSLPCGE